MRGSWFSGLNKWHQRSTYSGENSHAVWDVKQQMGMKRIGERSGKSKPKIKPKENKTSPLRTPTSPWLHLKGLVTGSIFQYIDGKSSCEPQQPWPASRRESSSCRRPGSGRGEGVRGLQAKEPEVEAQAEITQYRLQREKEFKAKEAVALGSQGSCCSEVEKETQEKMAVLQTYFRQNREEVLDDLLVFVCDTRPETHENYRIDG
ncbi:V-type proton ATPase subunit G 1 [Fukomys damarensis]|uniref:V-type proton ATPase subunit G 1 n=1 Tax=Fukomys damarensis TaxID=885580 RepID=A0A091ECV9_FUKDA|nr:V-type proton ATPase subunit G 1 [Fukomys damarensis]